MYILPSSTEILNLLLHQYKAKVIIIIIIHNSVWFINTSNILKDNAKLFIPNLASLN